MEAIKLSASPRKNRLAARLTGVGVGLAALAATPSLRGEVTVGPGAPLFPGQHFPTDGFFPTKLAVADVNLDGLLDVAVADASLGIPILLATGPGSYGTPSRIGDLTGSGDVAFGDLNEDGFVDLIVADEDSNQLATYLGLGTGEFLLRLLLPTGTDPESLVVGHVDSDEFLDVAVANAGSGDVSVFLGDGSGDVLPESTIDIGGPGGGALSLVAGDFNGDLILDLAVARQTADEIVVLTGTGGGLFGAPWTTTVVNNPWWITAGDLDGDGSTDLATANQLSDDVSVMIGQGNGTFIPGLTLATLDEPTAVVAAHVDQDGLLDLIVCHGVAQDVAVFHATGGGTFDPPEFVPVGGASAAIEARDIDGDSLLDLVLSNESSWPPSANVQGIAVLLQREGGELGPGHNLAVGDAPRSVAVGDLNHDGLPDLVVANGNTDDVSILLGLGSSEFATPVEIPAGETPFDVEIADFDHDGRLDIAVANLDSWSVSVHLGNGAGGFSPGTFYPVEPRPNSIAIADLNLDGLVDLAVTCSDANSVVVMLGLPGGLFDVMDSFFTGSGPISVEIADFSGDGQLDLVVANRIGDTAAVLFGLGGGAFGAPTHYPIGWSPRSVAVADFDGDGFSDVAVSNEFGESVAVMLGKGDGSFEAIDTYELDVRPYAIDASDLDGDGVVDLAVASLNGVALVLPGLGDGAFGAPAYFGASTMVALTIADLDLDSKPEVITANAFTDDITILEHTGTLLIQGTSVSPAETVTLAGGEGSATEEPSVTFTNTSDEPGEVSVELSGTPAPDAGGFGILGANIEVETSLADGQFFMVLTVPFELEDLNGADPLLIDLAYRESEDDAWSLAVAGNTVNSPGHPTPTGDRFSASGTTSPDPPVPTNDLGDYGVFWNEAELRGYAWANVDHATFFAVGLQGILDYGCGLNPSAALAVLEGKPQLGSALTVGIDDPSGGSLVGSPAVLLASHMPDPSFPCGTLLPGFGMQGPVGELLVSVTPPNPLVVLGPARWSGPGSPAAVDVPIPADPTLSGIELFLQGLLSDDGTLKLTDAMRITLIASAAR